MSVLHTCAKCLKEYKQKSSYEKHCKENQCEAPGFRKNSLTMNKTISLEDRQNQGIFFTPKKARDLVFEKLDELGATPTRILEPSFGSGEFLYDLKAKYPSADIVGVEYNTKLFASVDISGITLIESDFLKVPESFKFDLIVGNPPYFVTDQPNPECMLGRPNIYVAFLHKCLKYHLEPNGFLAFVLPTSLFNCSYYEPMRTYIANTCTIQYVEKLDVKYYQTAQDTMMILLQKTVDPSRKYIVRRNDSIYICPSYLEIQKNLEGSSTLHDLGFKVMTGDVVWNQVRDGKDPTKLQKSGKNKGKPYPDIGQLVDSGGTLLIYDSNIVKGSLVLGNIQDKEKKQYIKDFKKPARNQPTILVTRGHGNVYEFNCVLIKEKEFLAENHVNMIVAKTEEANQRVEAVYKALGDPRTKRFIEQFVGNGAMSATELERVLPIFLQ